MIKRLLLDFRARHNLTQSQLADLVGVTKTTVSRWETGLCVPYEVTQTKIRLIIEQYKKIEEELLNPPKDEKKKPSFNMDGYSGGIYVEEEDAE